MDPQPFVTPTSSLASVRLGAVPLDEIKSYFYASSWRATMALGLISPTQKGCTPWLKSLGHAFHIRQESLLARLAVTRKCNWASPVWLIMSSIAHCIGIILFFLP
jgi:hypothetical protein